MHMRTHRDRFRAPSITLLTFVLVTVSLAVAMPAAHAAGQSVSVDVTQASPSVTADGALVAAVNVTITEPAEYLEVRLRLRTPSGRLIYQKTEIRSDLPAGRHSIPYDYNFAGKGLRPGRYPIELRILATGSGPTQAADRLLIVDEDAQPVPVAVIASVMTTPSVDGSGIFLRDPARDDGVRAAIAYLAQLAMTDSTPFALLVPPVIIEELERAGAGYTTADGTSVDADSDAAQRCALTVADLRNALARGTLSLVDVPYALPDSRSATSTAEYDAQWRFTDSVFAGTLRSSTASATAYLGPILTDAARDALDVRRSRAVLAPPTSVGTGDGRVEPGCYSPKGSGPCLIVTDELAASAAELGEDDFYDVMHERLESGTASVIVLEVDGGSDRAAAIAQVLDWVNAVPWIEATSLSELPVGTERELLPLAPDTRPDPPNGYWEAVGSARALAGAFAAAAGADDPDARAATRASLVAQSLLWSLPADEWSDAATARTIADSARSFAEQQLSTVRLEVKDVTLSGRSGELPLTLTNGTGKQLTLRLTTTSEDVRTPEGDATIDAEAGSTFLTVPVDLGTSNGGALLVSVYAGSHKVTEATVQVRPSYIDRLATVGMVLIVLVGMLFFIRKRVNTLNAGTITEEA